MSEKLEEYEKLLRELGSRVKATDAALIRRILEKVSFNLLSF